jgi:hypothetical protein
MWPVRRRLAIFAMKENTGGMPVPRRMIAVTGFFCRPCRGSFALVRVIPWLTPWATFCRRYAASVLVGTPKGCKVTQPLLAVKGKPHRQESLCHKPPPSRFGWMRTPRLQWYGGEVVWALREPPLRNVVGCGVAAGRGAPQRDGSPPMDKEKPRLEF